MSCIDSAKISSLLSPSFSLTARSLNGAFVVWSLELISNDGVSSPSLNLGSTSPSLLKHWSQIHFLLWGFFFFFKGGHGVQVKSNQWVLLCAKRGTDHLGSAEDSPRLMLCERRAAWERGASWPHSCLDSDRIFGLFNQLPLCFVGTKVCVPSNRRKSRWPGASNLGISHVNGPGPPVGRAAYRPFFTLVWVWRMPAWVGICTRVWFITSVSQRGWSRSLLHRVPTHPASFTRMLEMEWFSYETNGSSVCSASVKLREMGRSDWH